MKSPEVWRPLRWRGRVLPLEGQGVRHVAGKRHTLITEAGFYWCGPWDAPRGKLIFVSYDGTGGLEQRVVNAEYVHANLGSVVYPRFIIDPDELPTPEFKRRCSLWMDWCQKAGWMLQIAPLMALEGRMLPDDF